MSEQTKPETELVITERERNFLLWAIRDLEQWRAGGFEDWEEEEPGLIDGLCSKLAGG